MAAGSLLGQGLLTDSLDVMTTGHSSTEATSGESKRVRFKKNPNMLKKLEDSYLLNPGKINHFAFFLCCALTHTLYPYLCAQVQG